MATDKLSPPVMPETPSFDAQMKAFLGAAAAAPVPRRRVPVAVVGVTAAALALVLVIPVIGGRPAGRALAGRVVLPDGTSFPVEELDGRGGADELRSRLTESGIEVDVEEVAVAPGAVGRVFEMALTHDADPPAIADAAGHGAALTPGDVMHLVIGRPARDGEQVTTEGLSYFEAYPALCEAVDPQDPAATARALADLGFDVEWLVYEFNPTPTTLIEMAPDVHKVDTPPPGTFVESLLRPEGQTLRYAAPPDQVLITLVRDPERAVLDLSEKCA